MSSSQLKNYQDKFSDWLSRTKKQLGYLSKELSNHPGDGFVWWFKNRQQYPALEIEVIALRLRADQDDFVFKEVFDCLRAFNLRDDDHGQAEWYQQADLKITALVKRLDKGDILVQGIFRGVLSELKYISEADTFHKHWGLIPLQTKVTTMYQHLLKQVDELKAASISQQSLQAKKLTIEEKKVELKKIALQKEALQIQKEKAEILKDKVIREKEYREAKREEHLEAQNLLQMEDKKQRQDTENKRREELQSSYADIANKWESQVKTGTDNID